MEHFRDNQAEQRYELRLPEGVSIARYRDTGGERVITHVETPTAARGQGHASALMAAIVAEARAKDITLRATCPFAVAYLKRHTGAVRK